MTADIRALSETSHRLEGALALLSSASRSVAEAASRAEGPDELARREEALSLAEQEVRGLLERRRTIADRIVERRRTIAALEADLSGKRTADALTGRWSVLQEPGEQKGVFRMALDGTIVSGEYTLEGGYSGSLRGTLVNDRLRLERVDSKQVSRRFRHEQVRPELLAKLRDEVLERGRGRSRGLLAPERIDQAIGRDRAARIDEQQGKESPLLRASELNRTAVSAHLERAQKAELEALHESVLAPLRSG